MPGAITLKDYAKRYVYGDPVNSALVARLSDDFINNSSTEKDRELLNAYNTGDVSRLEVIARSGEMLNIRVLLGMRRFNEEMAREFGEAWTKTEGPEREHVKT